MWDVEGSGMVPLPNMAADFRDTSPPFLADLANVYRLLPIADPSK
jgi:hypothetical protein